MPGVSLLRVARWCERMGISTATGYNYIKEGVVATVVIAGVRQIVESWGDNPPERQGRAPSFEELVKEAALEPRRPVRDMPQGMRVGRPPKASRGVVRGKI